MAGLLSWNMPAIKAEELHGFVSVIAEKKKSLQGTASVAVIRQAVDAIQTSSKELELKLAFLIVAST